MAFLLDQTENFEDFAAFVDSTLYRHRIDLFPLMLFRNLPHNIFKFYQAFGKKEMAADMGSQCA